MKISTNIVSPLEKCRQDLLTSNYTRLSHISALKGEKVDFQFILKLDEVKAFKREFSINAETDIDGLRLRRVRNVITEFDTYLDDPSKGTPFFLDYPNRVYPDILEEMPKGNILRTNGNLMAFWVDVLIPENIEKGEHSINFTVTYNDEIIARDSIILEVINASLPEPEHICTNWFHVDCLADYYNVPIYSDRHWEIIENFMKSAVENGINAIFVPILTPPLDTKIGHYRKTTQLVKITLENGKYSFDFSLLDKYIGICRRVGAKYFEMSHIFSQWGAKYAPKVVATVIENGKAEEKRIFGWDTPGTEGAYPEFLAQFLPELKMKLSSLGILDVCIFHVSDEPTLETLWGYKAAKETVRELLKGLKTIDACSNPEFFEMGLMETPVPTDTNMKPFLSLDIAERWTYYCCSWTSKSPNRMICYPSWRNRILGILMYKYNIKGFLQWAFNFYYDQGSVNLINPYTDMTGGGWVNAGDTFVVYPGNDGRPVESVRLAVFAEVFTDIRALKKCEELCGREAVLTLIDKECDISFDDYPANAEYILGLRENINKLIKNKLEK